MPLRRESTVCFNCIKCLASLWGREFFVSGMKVHSGSCMHFAELAEKVIRSDPVFTCRTIEFLCMCLNTFHIYLYLNHGFNSYSPVFVLCIFYCIRREMFWNLGREDVQTAAPHLWKHNFLIVILPWLKCSCSCVGCLTRVQYYIVSINGNADRFYFLIFNNLCPVFSQL